MRKAKGIRLGTFFFLLITACMLTAVATYFYVSAKVDNLGRNQQIYNKLNKVNDLINKNYVLPIDPVYGNDLILDGIVKGYIDGLEDEYSYYLDETDYRLSSSAMDTSRIGIGIRSSYDKKTDCVLVEFVKRNSPAESAGMKTGDIILSVNGTSVQSLGYRNSVYALTGPEGSSVTVTVQRKGETEPISITVSRVPFATETVQYRLLESGIGYLYINEFDVSTVSEFSAAVENLRNIGAKGFILDVRFNVGGDFSGMLEVLDLIMPSGLMCSVRQLSDDEAYYVSGEGHLSEKIVVLQNFATSDVAEVFSAAFQDTQTATIVGDVSRGKGVGQRDIPLSDGTAIHISTYEYITPNGKQFNKNGIVPDVLSSLSDEKINSFFSLADAEDDQLQAALRAMRSQLGTS